MAAKSRPKREQSSPKREVPAARRGGFWRAVRDNADALIFAILIAMFIRIFVCELFKIPSPSMTPTLLGTEPGRQAISYYDVNEDGVMDMILKSDYTAHVFEGEGRHYRFAGSHPLGETQARLWLRDAHIHQDRILVAKFLYWFRKPDRGDIAVFRVPEAIFEIQKPVYIKRVVGLPGETLTFEPAPGVPGHPSTLGRLLADGRLIESPPFFTRQAYEYRAIQGIHPYAIPDYYQYRPTSFGYDIERMRVPEDSVVVLGDNTVSSQDSRYWGSVPLDRLRGRALFRFWFRIPRRWGIVPIGLDTRINFLE